MHLAQDGVRRSLYPLAPSSVTKVVTMRRLLQFRLKKDGAKAPVKTSTSSIVAAPAVSLPAQAAGAVLQGLQVVCEGTNPVIDIVAVHGLNGHCEKTWTAAKGANSVNWLRDLLPHDLPDARILSWGYDANTHSGSHISSRYLYDHSRSSSVGCGARRGGRRADRDTRRPHQHGQVQVEVGPWVQDGVRPLAGDSRDVDTLKQGYAAAARRIYRDHPSLVHLKAVAEAVISTKRRRWLSDG
ncbi:unnamed protein product [Alternaria alternata]